MSRRPGGHFTPQRRAGGRQAEAVDPPAHARALETRSAARVEEQSRDHRARFGSWLVHRAVWAVQQVAPVHQGRRATAVQVDRVRGAERDQQAGKLSEVEAGVDAGAAPVAADREQLIVVDTESAARMALGRDVGVELPSACREALAIVVVDDHAATGNQPRARLDQVPGRSHRDLPAGRKNQVAIRLDVHAAACRPEWRGDRLVRDQAAIDSHLPERPPRIANEEAGDNRLGSVVRGAPVVKPLCLLEARHPHPRRAPRMDDHVDRRLPAVGQPDA